MQNYVNKMFPQAALSNRTDTAVSKPPVFHSAIKRRDQPQHLRNSKPGKFLKGKRKNVSLLLYSLLCLGRVIQNYYK